MQPTAAFLIIGNEILSGRTQDKNLAFLGAKLAEKGIALAEVRVVRDVEQEIIGAVKALSAKYTYVFTSGGIGPTHDDITAATLAKAFDAPLALHPEALRRLEKHYETSTQPFNEARRKMAYIPKGAALIDNPVSAAPGFIIKNLYVMAGVPSIFQAMVANVLADIQGGAPTLSRTVTTNITEGTLAKELGEIQAAFPLVEIGSYPHIRNGKLGVALVARSTDTTLLTEAEKAIQALVVEKGGELLEG